MNEINSEVIIGGGGCFLEDTKVLTPTGLTPIISVKEGDLVICFDDKGKLHTSKVLSTNSHTNKEVYRYNLWGGSYLDATPNHWVLNGDNSFIEIGKVDESISLVNASGFLTPIVSKEYLGEFTVYNLIVDTYHTYIANGIRVHNGGGGKSGSSHVPSEAPDTLKSKSYAKVLDLIQEGEVEGLVNGARSIYFNGTPLMNSDGTFNYNDVSWDFRNGTSDQVPMEGFDEIESETQESVKITKSISKTISIVDPTIDKVRLALSIPSLFQQESDGDLVGSEISYQIYLQKNGGNGVGAEASVGTIANGVITSIPITNGGSGYPTAGTTLTIGAPGTGATATPIVRNGVIKTITINDPGYNYSWINATITGNGTGARIEPVLEEQWIWGGDEGYSSYYALIAIKIIDPGYGYTTASVVITGDGYGARATANIVNGVIVGLNLTNGGQNYITATTVTATGSGGSGATFGTISISNGVIKTINVLSSGSGYDSPVITIVDAIGAGYGATAIGNTDTAGAITSISVVSGGAAYTTANTVISISNGGFYPATLTDNSSVITTNSTYTYAPFTFVNGYLATLNKTKGLIALINPYIRPAYTFWTTTYPLYYGYSPTSKNAQFVLRYRKSETLDAYTTIASGILDYASSQVFFKLEEVKNAYNTIKASNPSITLTYDQYIRNRLDAESPEAPGNIKDRVASLAGYYGYIFPVPYIYYDTGALPETSSYQFILSTKGTDETTYVTSIKAALYDIVGYYDTVGNTIKGKTTSKYTINHTIILPRTTESDRFDIKIARLTDDSNLSSLQNDLYFESYANIVSNKLRYPNSAMVGIRIDSENFSSIPTRGYHLKLLKIKIPDNYDPINGIYNRRTTEVPAATNLLTYSESFDNAAWNKQRCSVDPTPVAAPNGTTTAEKIIASGTADPYVPQSVIENPIGKTYTFSVWLWTDAGQPTGCELYMYGQTGVALSDVGAVSITLTDTPQRFTYTKTFASSATNTVGRFDLPQLAAAGQYIYAWGAQLEIGSTATDYIRTDSVSMTRPLQPVGSLAYDALTGAPVEQLWTGNFYTAWSNNPAWCFYDLVTNDRYGLGEYIQAEHIDEYTLYSIGKYCDELVPNGYGGLERRFLLNTYIQTRQEAVRLLQDIASAFRGMIYWSTGLITAVQDASGQTPVYQFNNSNVINGEFSYSGASRKVIHNAALVTWNDPLLLYKQRVEYVEDREAIDKYGYNPTDVVAFGCTSRGQAHRMGKALLYTEKVENNLVNFKAALDASYIRPGLLIKVQDDTRSGTLSEGNIIGGKIISVSGTTVVLDRPLTMGGSADFKIRFNTINPSPNPDLGFTDYLKTSEYSIVPFTGTNNTITLTQTVTDTNIVPGTVYTIKVPSASEELFKILAIKESEDPGIYEIAAMLHNPSKYSYIEEGLTLEDYKYSTLNNVPRVVTFNPPVTVEGVITSAPLMDNIYMTSGGISTYLNISFNASLYAARYDIYLKKDTDDYVLIAKDLNTTSYTQYNIKDGSSYRVKIVAKNFTGLQSVPAYYPPLAQAAYIALGKTRPPSDVNNFHVSVTEAGFIEGTWDNISDIDLNVYEIRVGTTTNTWTTASPLKIVKATSFTTEATLIGEKQYFIKAKDTSNIYSTNAATDTLTILAPSKPTVAGQVSGTSIKISWNDCKTTLPIKYYYIYLNSTATAVATVGSVLSYDLPISWTSSASIYVKAQDIAGNYSSISNAYNSSLTGPVVNSHTTEVINANYIINIVATQGSLPISKFLVKFDAQNWTSAVSYSSTSISVPITWIGNEYVEVKAVDILGVESNVYVVGNLFVNTPIPPTINVLFSNTDNSVKLSWNDCKTTLPIDYYEVSEDAIGGGTVSLGKTYTLEAIYPVNWSGVSNNYYVKAIDINGNQSSLGTATATPTTWGPVLSLSNTISDSNCNLKWLKPTTEGSFSLKHYTVWENNTSGMVLGSTITENLSIPIYWTGSKVFCVAAIDFKDYRGTTATITASVSLPVAPAIIDAECGFTLDSYVLKWESVPLSPNTVPIQEYEVGYYTNYGATNQAEVSVGRIKGTVFSAKAQWIGPRVFWVKSVDILGNTGTSVDTITLTVNAPSQISSSTLKIEVVDNNVLLYWGVPSATLPILTYEIREGDSWSVDYRYIGTKTGNFTTIFETSAGVFTYWLAAIDSAGNYGTPISVTTTVNQPPDYILKADEYTTFSGTKNNMLAEVDGTYLMPIDTTETWENHFTNRNWTTPQQQVDDLFTLFIEPGTTTGYYEETIDYLTALAANKITISPTYDVLTGEPRVKCDIYTSLDNSTWLPNMNTWATYATNFRYVKYRITVDGAKDATYTQTSTTATISLASHGLLQGDPVYLDFRAGASSNINDNTYTVSSVTNTDEFKVVVTTSASQASAASVFVYSSKFYGIVTLKDINIRLDSKLRTITGSIPVRNTIASVGTTQSGFTMTLNKTTHGIKVGEVVELDYALSGATYSQSGATIVVTATSHGFIAGEKVILDFTSGTATEDYFEITAHTTGNFTVSSTVSVTTSGTVSITQPFKVITSSTDSFTVTNLVSKSLTRNASIDPKGTCAFLTVDRSPDTDREFIDVDAITLTPNSPTALITTYDFTDKPNPYFFRIIVYDAAGTRTSVSSCSYTIRGF